MLTLAHPSDLPAAVALINASYRGETAWRGWAHEADYIDGERTTLEMLRSDFAANPKARLYLRIPTKPATYSDLKPAIIPISCRPLFRAKPAIAGGVLVGRDDGPWLLCRGQAAGA